MLAKIKLDEMNHYLIAATGIEPDGLARIAELLESAGIPTDVMEHVEPVWTTKRGTYPKRLAKVLKRRGYMASPALMGAIGQAAADNTSRTDEYWFRIDMEFTCDKSGFLYEKGAHGDGDSCYHPGGLYDHAPYDIEHSGGMLLRTFEPSSPEFGYHFDYAPDDRGRWYAGIARCFIIPCTYHDSEGGYHESFVLINGYCQPGYSHDLLHLARLVATAEGLSYRKVSILDHFRQIYVNNNSGYLLGAWEDIHNVRSVDIYVKSSGRTPNAVMFHCNLCGDRYEKEDLTIIGDDLVCPECLRVDCIPCGRCGEWALKIDAPIVSGKHWCRYCADEYTTACVQCGERHPRVEMYKVSREYWCENCTDRYALECAGCGALHAQGELSKENGRYFCQECSRIMCCACGESVDNPIRVDGWPYCRQCAPV